MKTVYYETDVLVIGGGLPGVCAAIAAKRNGAETIILERGMNLGGNCGPEIGVHPSDGHRYHPYMAATGIVSEIIEAATISSAKTNTDEYHYNICMQWDSVMSQMLKKEKVTLLRRHYAHTPIVENGRITEVHCEDTATYKHVCIRVRNVVIDASGDGNVSAQAGALYEMGREAKITYNERLAPDKADKITLGSSLVALVRKTEKEVKFVPPENTPEFFPGYWGDLSFNPAPNETLKFFFPTESGGEIDTVEDDHEIYETLLGQLYSAWNRIKNVTHIEESKNWELLWVSSRIGKRESRRFKGDYVLNANDVESGKVFDDCIAVGGFYTDVHYPNPQNPKYVELLVGSVPPNYTIPYRSIYSVNISNLMFASRLLSVSHLAHASVRVQRTLASIAQASGTASALCTKYNLTPREIGQKYIEELQQLLVCQDAVIPIKQKDIGIIKYATLKASDEATAKVITPKKFMKISTDCGIQLWSFENRLESISLWINAYEDCKLKLKLLRYKNDEPWQETRMPFGNFECFEISNETEWGLDNRKNKYREIGTSSVDIQKGNLQKIKFNFDAELDSKDIMSDEDKLMLVFDSECNAEFAVTNEACDYARLVCGTSDAMYEVRDGTAIFEVVPDTNYGKCENIKNGYTRRFATYPTNMWKPQHLPATLEATWDKVQYAEYAEIYFDTIMRTYREEAFECAKEASPQCAKIFDMIFYENGQQVKKVHINDNKTRKCRIDAKVNFDKIEIIIYECHEEKMPGIYKIDIKQEKNKYEK